MSRYFSFASLPCLYYDSGLSISVLFMTDPINTVVPPPEEEPRVIEEIVSPVKPRHRNYIFGEVVSFLSLLVAVFALGYVVYGHWPKFGQGIKVAKAPETTTVQEKTDGISVAVRTPDQGAQVTVTDSLPTPRISSIATTTPNVNAGMVSGQTATAPSSAAATPSRTYTSKAGFSFRLPAGGHVTRSSDGLTYSFTDSHGMLARVEVAEFLLDNPGQLQAQLMLSPDISSVVRTSLFGHDAYTYTNRGVSSFAIVHGTHIFYITDFSGSALSRFALN